VFYKADTGRVTQIKIDEITVSFACSHYPRELIKHLKENYHWTIEKKEQGIYYILGDMFPVQILVLSELSVENNLWLHSLTNNLKDVKAAERLTYEYEKKSREQIVFCYYGSYSLSQ